MRRKMSLFLPVVLLGGIFFFLLIGISVLSDAPTPDVNRTPALAESANETAQFQEPVRLGWQGAMLAAVACGGLAVTGLFLRRVRGR